MTGRDQAQAPLLRPLASQRVGNLSPQAKIILAAAIGAADGAAYLGPGSSPADDLALDELLEAGLIRVCQGNAYSQLAIEATDLARSQARDLDQAMKDAP